MKLYIVTAEIDVSEDGTRFDQNTIWAGSQAEAASARKELVDRGARRKDVKTYAVDVPTDKTGLLQFFNDLGNIDVRMLVAIHNLIS